MTDAYAVLGHPIAHSLSPRIHAAFAASTGQALRYDAIDVAPGGLAAFLDSDAGRDLAGANVTLPHKEAALAVASSVTGPARRAGAVNTLSRRGDSWHGDNTDGAGLLRDLIVNQCWEIEGRRLLIVGAGGATRGIVQPLLDAAPASITIANRTAGRAELLARDFGVAAVTLAGLKGRYDAVINASAAGHRGTAPALGLVRLSRDGWAYDLSYGAAAQPFLAWARDAGARAVADGLGMLVEQAAESFLAWRGVRPATAPMLARLRG